MLYLRLDFVGKWNTSLRNILNKKSPRIRPCGTQPTQNHKTTHSKRSHGNCKWTTYLNNFIWKIEAQASAKSLENYKISVTDKRLNTFSDFLNHVLKN